MAKNLIPEVCKLLGVEVGEKFKIKDVHTGYTPSNHYFIDNDGQVNVFDDSGSFCTASAISLNDFLIGEVYEIVKLPWKPKTGETFYSFGKTPSETLRVVEDEWLNLVMDLARFKAGWVYRTYEDALDALPIVAKEIGVGYEL